MIKVRNIDNQPLPATQPINEPIQQIQPAISDIDELHKQAQLAVKYGAVVTITGQWVWAEFKSKPAVEVLAVLKSNKWIWCHNKSKWAYRGVLSHSRKAMPWEYITSKYGEVKVEELV